MAPDSRRFLVTGGSGFIGTNLVKRLRSVGGEVVSLDIEPPRDSEQAGVWTEADLQDLSATEALVSRVRPTHVLHLAARTDMDGTTPRDYSANTDGTANLLEALASLDAPPRLLAASSRMVCRIGYQPRDDRDYCPPNAYGQSKMEMEHIVREADYPGVWALVRPTSTWGPWFGVPYRDFFLTVARGRYRHPAARQIRKSFGYVENTVHQIVALLEAPEDEVHGRMFYLADYEPIEVRDWANLIARETGNPRSVKTVPVGLLHALAVGGDLLKRAGWREPPLTTFRLRNLLTEMLYDLDPIRRIAPTLPVPLDEGVARTVRWLRDTGALEAGGPAG